MTPEGAARDILLGEGYRACGNRIIGVLADARDCVDEKIALRHRQAAWDLDTRTETATDPAAWRPPRETARSAVEATLGGVYAGGGS